ncbi:MAG: sigma-70 family RNA polymerase sigma factor [Rubricoccaceae bacterium]
MTPSPELQQAVERYLAAPGEVSRAEVVRAGLPLVHALVGRLGTPNHPLATREDLEGTAIEGLLQALDSYDAARGALFVTHAYRRVHGALVDYLRSIDVLSRERRRRYTEAQRAADRLRQALGDEPSDGDVADLLGISLADYHDLLATAQLRFTLSLDAPAGDEDASALADLIEDEYGEAGFEAVERASVQAQLEREIPRLPERQRVILGLYYHENLTLRQIGEVLGVSDARISQILGQTMLTLRARLSAERSGEAVRASARPERCAA